MSNVALVFHPTRGWAEPMYPGDDVTDWIAFSVFNHDLCLPTPEGLNGGCQPGAHLDQNLAKNLEWAETRGKPLMIAESTVQKPSDETTDGFREYLSRLLEIADQHPQLRGLTYINMKWAGGWVYGKDWTEGAFGNVDARLTRFPETRAFFCDQLSSGRFVSAQGTPLACDAGGLPELALPPNADAPTFEAAGGAGQQSLRSRGRRRHLGARLRRARPDRPGSLLESRRATARCSCGAT